MKNYKQRGFTLIEVLIGIIVMSFATIIIATLFSSTLKTSITQKSIQERNVGAKSQIENAISTSKVFSDYYIKSNGGKKQIKQRKPAGYKNPEPLEFNGKLTIGGVAVPKINGYFLYASNDKYSINNSFKDYSLYTFVSEGYSIPQTAGFDENLEGLVTVVSDNRFMYMYNDNVSSTIQGKYQVEKDDSDLVKLVKSVRTGWYVSNVYDESKNAFLLPYTDDDEDFNLRMQNLRATGESKIISNRNTSGKKGGFTDVNSTASSIVVSLPNLQGKAGFDYIDSDIFCSAQTLNKNGYAGSVTLSYPGKEKNYYSAVHFIGLPYLHNLLNHNDANLVVRNDHNKWYFLGTKEGFDVKESDDFKEENGVNCLNWKDVRDYTDNYNAGGKLYSKGDCSSKGAIDFSSHGGYLSINGDIYGKVSYNRDNEFKTYASKGLTVNDEGEVAGTIIEKFILNDDFEVNKTKDSKYEPYRLLSINLKEDGSFDVKGDKKAVGLQVYVDNKNKLWIDIVDFDSSRIEKPTDTGIVRNRYDVVKDMIGSDFGLSDKQVLPYFYETERDYIKNDDVVNRDRYYIMALEYSKDSIIINLLGYDDSKPSYKKYTNFTAKYDLSVGELQNNMSLKIGGNNIISLDKSGMQNPDLELSANSKKVIDFTDFLYYNDNLSTRDINGNKIYSNNPNTLNAKELLMDYLYRKNLTTRERFYFDSTNATGRYSRYFR